jgi:hypothetical protein
MLLRRALFALQSVVLLAAFSASGNCHALGEKQHVVFAPSPQAFPISQSGSATAIYVDPDDWPGVSIAAHSFATDVQSVSGKAPRMLTSLPRKADEIILIGTLGHSPMLDRLIASHKLDVREIRGHWEMSITRIIAHPFPGIRRAVVIAGADKRGTIFGIYDLSEQIGVSPWAWWADVPIAHHDNLFLLPETYVQPQPRVKYRGIFLNDEAPALSGWAHEKFGGFNHLFYVHVFELLLRLKANYLWPAMWDSAFNEDDPLNPKLADEYGIVMGTSHHEPMMRAQQEWKRHGVGPWNYATNSKELNDFWRAGIRRNKDYEEIVTIGMRGDGDKAMSPTTNTALLERIVADQRTILAQEMNPDVTKIPQVWALYKEVQSYYEKGMRVPDDVTLLWCDDNWGNIRRLPTAGERSRSGGAGIYYHFDYVGDPRSYKWLNTYSITKVWEQMNLATQYGANRIWIVNVGDLKPMEFPIEFFLSMAREPQRWSKDHLQEFTRLWAAREFGSAHADEIADLIATYTKYNSRRKPEQLTPATYSLTDGEADRVNQEWRMLAARSEKVNAELPEAARAAYFELVLYPIEACATVGEMYIAAGRNQLYARQGRASANQYADETEALFKKDAALSWQYNHLLNGRWDHMMDQTHIGYTYWNEPPLNAMPAVQRVQPLQGSHMEVFVEGDDPTSRALPKFDAVNRRTYDITVANSGAQSFRYIAKPSASWIHINNPEGNVITDDTVQVSIDWSAVPSGNISGTIAMTHVGAPWDDPTTIQVAVQAVAAPVTGFAEDNDTVVIDAAHTTSRTDAGGVSWQEIPGFGETHSGIEAFPVTADSTLPPVAQACMDYDFTLYASGQRTLETILAPTLSFMPGRGLRYSIALDHHAPTVIDAWAPNTEADWAQAVSDGVHRIATPLGDLADGAHHLQLCRVDPGVVVERLLISRQKADHNYLGGPESVSVAAANHP